MDTKRIGEGTQLVLARCDNPKAFQFAKGLGINFVQGRLADQFFKSGIAL